MAKMHTMRNGEKIAIADMSDSHLEATIAMIKRAAEKGVTVIYVLSYFDEYEFAESVFYGTLALDYLNYGDYVQEHENREKLKRKMKHISGMYLPFGC